MIKNKYNEYETKNNNTKNKKIPTESKKRQHNEIDKPYNQTNRIKKGKKTTSNINTYLIIVFLVCVYNGVKKINTFTNDISYFKGLQIIFPSYPYHPYHTVSIFLQNSVMY